ncbi:hypothetical protein, variant [Verruconis gallopava]|uniref:Indoleamine 2,3-dioxygenase n=1 Tax=Verruconis gallopava TaxID=253628 RepID=A0A0D2B995_9PEZI|nr:hypothetical protein, variant [Verruconis gallopava]KIW07824.1 hypothetical protein, variant [Verruconis gallopava]
MDLQVLDPCNFGISPKHGFLSSQPPLSSFKNKYYEPWDDLISNLPVFIKSNQLFQKISELPLLRTAHLDSDLEYQRAYVVLAFLVHGFVWSGTPPREVIPAQLAEPFLTVCEKLGLKPVLSYAGLCLWNWKLQDPRAGFELENMDTIGGHLMHLLLGASNAAKASQRDAVVEALKKTEKTIISMGNELSKLYPVLKADFFYNELRPFIAGGKDMEEKGLPRGMIFLRSNGKKEEYKLPGGNAGQSSLFQFVDCLLGVVHEDPIFFEMRSYMPQIHRNFLHQISKLSSLRTYLQTRVGDDELWKVYNDCVKELKTWRGKHMAVVSKYIIQPARKAVDHVDTFPEEMGCQSANNCDNGDNLRGTGGSALLPFLRQARDETAALEV